MNEKAMVNRMKKGKLHRARKERKVCSRKEK
jgi:hypothetical protein